MINNTSSCAFYIILVFKLISFFMDKFSPTCSEEAICWKFTMKHTSNRCVINTIWCKNCTIKSKL